MVVNTRGGMAELDVDKNKFKTKTRKEEEPKKRVADATESDVSLAANKDDPNAEDDTKNGSDPATATVTAKKNDDDNISFEEIGSVDESESESDDTSDEAEMINLRGEGVLSDQDIMEKVLGSSRGHSRGIGRKLSSASSSSSSVSSKSTRNVAPSVEQYMTTWFQALKAANPGIVIPDIPNFNGSCAEGEDMGDENEEGNLNDEDENEEGDENDEEDENDEDA